MSIPKVFISYSHDSTEHKKWTLDLATRLRSFGVDAVIDQWDLRPGDDLTHFMETQLSTADRVLMVCTPKYVEKANGGIGGVGYEKMIVTASLLARIDSNKVIPIIRQAGTAYVPTFLKTKLYLDFSQSDQMEFSFDELVRTLHNAPLYEKPPVTKSPFPIAPTQPSQTQDALKELMTLVVAVFDRGTTDFIKYSELVKGMAISRILLDLLCTQAVEKGLLRRTDRNEWFLLTHKGKEYAIENGLVK